MKTADYFALSPCPFDGGRAEFDFVHPHSQQDEFVSQLFVHCTTCHVRSPSFSNPSTRDVDVQTYTEAVEWWNRRP
jgi:hypothetical protein